MVFQLDHKLGALPPFFIFILYKIKQRETTTQSRFKYSSSRSGYICSSSHEQLRSQWLWLSGTKQNNDARALIWVC
jgi:hypothetical protein